MYRTKIKERLEAKRAEAQQKWTEFDELRKGLNEEGIDATKSKVIFDQAHEKQREYAEVKAEVDTLFSEYEKALEMDGVERPKGLSPFSDGEDREGSKSESHETPGEKFVKSAELKALVESGILDMEKGRVQMNPVKAMSREDVKTLLTGAGAPGTQILRPQRLPGIMPMLQAPLKLTDLITIGETDSNVIEWVRMSAIANNAAEVSEATATAGVSGTKPESGMTFVIDSTTVRTIAHWIPATKQSLQDMPQLRTLVDSVLLDGVARRLNSQILNGDGVAPNLRGILNTPGILTQALGADSPAEAILKAITQVRLQFLEPSAILMHPTDFQTLRLMKDANGNFIFGPPSAIGNISIWGLNIVQDVTIAQGTALVADWSQAILYVRDSVNVLATDSHQDFFVRNMVAILAEGRYGIAVPRPAAFITVTGL